MPDLYKNDLDDPRGNAQRNLCGRTHYVDDNTLKFHKSRVLKAGAYCGGLLFAIVTSDSLDWEGRRRGYRYRIFDVFGTCVAKVETQTAFTKRQHAEKAMFAELDTLDARALTTAGIANADKWHKIDMDKLAAQVAAIGKDTL